MSAMAATLTLAVVHMVTLALAVVHMVTLALAIVHMVMTDCIVDTLAIASAMAATLTLAVVHMVTLALAYFLVAYFLVLGLVFYFVLQTCW